MGDQDDAYRKGSDEQQAREDYRQLYLYAYFHSYTEPEKRWNSVDEQVRAGIFYGARTSQMAMKTVIETKDGRKQAGILYEYAHENSSDIKQIPEKNL